MSDYPLSEWKQDCSLDESGQFLVHPFCAGGEGHVHEFAFRVELETTLDACVDLVLDRELLAFVVWVGLESGQNFFSLGVGEL